MRFMIRSKEGKWVNVRRQVTALLKRNGCEYTDKIEPGCDFALVIGGDGTLLNDHWRFDCPILGINPGSSVGFYMLACKNDFEARVLSLINGKAGKDYYVHGLPSLRARINGKAMQPLALNEVLVSPVYVRRLMDARLQVGGKDSLERSSAIIVYTPTGSHAFAHSAGASRLAFDSDRIGITALAPYSGSLKRGDILIGDGRVRITYMCDEGEVCLDGSEMHIKSLRKGDVVEVGRSGLKTRIVGFRKKIA